MTQRPAKTHSASLSADDKIPLMHLVQFLKDAHEALEEEGDEDAAFRFEMLIDWFQNHYTPSTKLEFRNFILGL